MNIFFSGIAGSGMSALALFSAARGHEVSGSDRQFDDSRGAHIKSRLEAAGVNLFPQDGSGIGPGLDLMVMSTAVEKDRPEVLKADGLGIKRMTRPEYLASVANEHRSIAMAGTSGKSTASGMLASAMSTLGLGPNFIGGGRVRDFRSDSNTGNVLTGESDWLVMEADESDGSLVNYIPSMSVISNLSLDHNPVKDTAAMFSTLISRTTGTVALNADDKGVMGLERQKKCLTYSIKTPSDLRAGNIELKGLGSAFTVKGQRFELRVPGLHNIYNALAAICMLRELGVSLREAAEALACFGGIERRFEVHLNEGGRMVIDDYAHNAHKLEALISTTRGMGDSVCYIFQPHGFGPLRMMLHEYARVFNSGLRPEDSLYVLPVFYSGGTVARDISSADLARPCGAKAPGSRESLLEDIAKYQSFDLYVVLGARDDSLSELAAGIARMVGGDTP